MEEQAIQKNEILDNLSKDLEASFKLNSISVRAKNGLDVKIDKDKVPVILSYLKNDKGFLHLSHISIVDWIEDNHFEIIYILWSHKDKTQVFVKCLLNREDAKAHTVKELWQQAHTYEREMHEMYGVSFIGNENLKEFILEGWDEIPPMRRDFITDEYVKTAFFERPGREDKKNVRDTMEERTREVLPEFAKKYSR